MKLATITLTSVSIAALSVPAVAQEQPSTPATTEQSQSPPASPNTQTSVKTQAPADTIGEIVVTAQKRTESLKDVPIPVTVVTKDQLAAQRVYTIQDLARTAPSLEIVSAFGGPGGGGQIRGLGTQSFTRSAEGAVGIVVDGVPQGNVPNLSIFDVDRVEVLRGPQGTLFGLTASAGVINMSTTAPDPRRASGYVHVDYAPDGTLGSEFGQVTTRAAVNMPFSSNSALRVAVNYNRLQGVEENAATGTDDVKNDYAVRARYLWRPSSAVTVNLIGDYDYYKQNYADPQFVYVNVAPGTPLAAQLAACGITASWDNNKRCESLPNKARNKNYGLSGQVDWDVGSGTVTSITGWRKNKQLPLDFDIMANPADIPQIFQTGNIAYGKQFSQELRFTSAPGAFEYTAGLFYSDYKGSTGFTDNGSFDVGFFPAPGVFIPFAVSRTFTKTTNKSYAAFGQGTYHITPQLGLIAGLRYTHQKLTDQSVDELSPGSETSGSTSKSNVSGKVGIQYEPNRHLDLYATVTRGYKGPQVIPAALGSPTTVIGAEIPTAYELGGKGSVFAGRLGYEVSAFLTKVKNYQGQRCGLTPVGVLNCVGESIPSVTSKGIEASLFGRPVRNLYLNGGFMWNVAKFPAGWTGFNPDDLTGTIPTNLGGDQLVGSPRTKFTANAEYTIPMGSIEGFLGGDAVHKSSVRLGYSGDPRFVYPAHWSLALRAGIRSADKKWNLEVFGRNLTQNREPATLFGGPSFLPPGILPFLPLGTVNGISGWQTPASRRQVGISAEYRF